VAERGQARYGLHDVTQLEHALQAALLAEQEAAPDELVVAALLHDVGHLLHGLGEDFAERGIDDKHEELGRRFLERWFGPEVSEPVALHVAAKRYLCAVESDYFSKLSHDSVASLALQGGPMSADEVRDFSALPGAAAAVRLRRWDDLAKETGLPTPAFEHYLPAIRRVAKA
jgi:phosphonate degradation associated HDIG domain protein